MKIYNFFLSLAALIFGWIALCSVWGGIRFGHGLGDLVYYLGALLLCCLSIGIFFIARSNRIWISGKIFLLLFYWTVLIYFFLKMSILRGVESRWDGNIFF